MATVDRTAAVGELLARLGVEDALHDDGDLVVRTPITGEEIGRVRRDDAASASAAVARATDGVRRVAGRPRAAAR